MKTAVEALENNRSKVTVTLDAKSVDARIKKTYKDFAFKYNFPGFRRGKAPRPIIDNMLGKETVRSTVTNDVVNKLPFLAIDENNLFPVSKPEFPNEPELVKGGEDFTFEFEVECKPEFELSNYDAVSIELPGETATDKEIDDHIERFREHYFNFEDAPANTKVKDTSDLYIEIEATGDDGNKVASLSSEKRPYTVGSGIYPTEFDDELIGLKKGQSASFELEVGKVKSPLFNPLKGKTKKVKFNVNVLQVRKKVLPELTDEWVKNTLGFKDIADMRNNLADSLSMQKKQMMPGLKERACLEKLSERLNGGAPENLCQAAEAQLYQDFFQQLQGSGTTLDEYLKRSGITSEQFKEDIKKQAADTVKQDLALDAWAKHFEITCTEEDIKKEFERSGAEDPAALEKDWRENGQMYRVREGVMRGKATKDVMDKAHVSEAKPKAKASKAEGAKASTKAKEPAKKAASTKAKASSASKKETSSSTSAAKKTAAKKPAAKKTTTKKASEKSEKPSAKK